VHTVTSSHIVTVFARAALDDVAMGVSRFMVIGDMLRGRRRPVSSGRLGMNRGLSLLSGGFDEPLRGWLASPRGRALGLLHSSGLEEFSNFISSSTGIGVRWLGHVAEEHGGGDNVLAGSSENRGVDRPILVDAAIDVASSLMSSPAMCVCRTLILNGLLE
jgi:hypothetical protein